MCKKRQRLVQDEHIKHAIQMLTKVTLKCYNDTANVCNTKHKCNRNKCKCKNEKPAQ